MGLKILKYNYTIVCVCVCVCVYKHGTFIKINQKNIVSKHGYILQNHKKRSEYIRLNNISKFLRLNLTWIHFKVKEKRMYAYKFKNGLEKN